MAVQRPHECFEAPVDVIDEVTDLLAASSRSALRVIVPAPASITGQQKRRHSPLAVLLNATAWWRHTVPCSPVMSVPRTFASPSTMACNSAPQATVVWFLASRGFGGPSPTTNNDALHQTNGVEKKIDTTHSQPFSWLRKKVLVSPACAHDTFTSRIDGTGVRGGWLNDDTHHVSPEAAIL